MTALYTTHPEYFNDICEAVRLFIDTRRIELLESPEAKAEDSVVLHTLELSGGMMTSTARFFTDGVFVSQSEFSVTEPSGSLETKREAKRASKISVYRALLKHFRTTLPWGSLTGIRPTKLLRDSEALLGTDTAKSLFLNTFDVSPQKYALAKAILDAQSGLYPKDDDLDVYIGIPFCVTRCAYCSFASYTPDVFKDAEEQYVCALLHELSCAEEIISGRRVRALYVGGGTPTALSQHSLEKVLVRASQLARGADEFTVEAGRPDTITAEKLALIKASGARRLSVNAQTMFDETLQRIGRRHTAAEFLAAYELAAQAGFDAINVDLIAGLPGETEAHTEQSLRQVMALKPQNVTVHTLAVKRASKFAEANMGAFPTDAQTAQTLETAHAMLEAAGYYPYYMYRQKYMKGSLENAGYTRPGHACLYNIDNMEELCDVLAFGAGAISKRLFNGGARIERAANVKDLKGYIERHTEMADAKRLLFECEKNKLT